MAHHSFSCCSDRLTTMHLESTLKREANAFFQCSICSRLTQRQSTITPTNQRLGSCSGTICPTHPDRTNKTVVFSACASTVKLASPSPVHPRGWIFPGGFKLHRSPLSFACGYVGSRKAQGKEIGGSRGD
jgi:hypothetical protein